MNNHGDLGLKEVFLFLSVMCLSILVVMIMYNRNLKDLFGGTSESSTYQEVEEQLINAAKSYTSNYYYKALENGDNDYVTTQTLQENGLIDVIADPKDGDITCTGYVNFYKRSGHTQYDPYIKCGQNYHTKGYNLNYDAN